MTTGVNQATRSEVLLTLVLGVVLIGCMALGLRQLTDLHLLQWSALAGGLWLLVCWQLWQRLALNRADAQAPLYGQLGWANRLTFWRGGLIALTGGFLFQPQAQGWVAWLPGLLYCIAALLDRLDGFVARRSGQISLLGSALDTTYDALGLLVAPLLAVGYGQLHESFLLVSAAYYCFVAGVHWRERRGLAVYPLMPSQLRRTLAGFQMGFIALILLPCFEAHLTRLMGVAFMLPILLGFVVDWWVVSGRIASSDRNRARFVRLSQLSHQYFQPLLRLVLCSALAYWLASHTFDLSALLIFALGTVLVALGLLGRVGALLVLIALASDTLTSAEPLLSGIVLFASSWLLLLGTGRFSLWQWDDYWVNRRDGEVSK